MHDGYPAFALLKPGYGSALAETAAIFREIAGLVQR